MSIELGLSKLPHSVGVLCILRPEFCLGVSAYCLGISADFFSVACPDENCPKLSKIIT